MASTSAPVLFFAPQLANILSGCGDCTPGGSPARFWRMSLRPGLLSGWSASWTGRNWGWGSGGTGISAQCLLALGGLPNVARFISVLLVTLAGALAVSDQRWTNPNWAAWLEHASQIFIVCFFMVLLFHGLLMPLRWLLGWRLDFDPAYHASEKTGRLQVGVVHFLGWTTFLAIPCAIIRMMPREDLAEIATICLSISAMTLPVAASSTLAVVGKRRWL